MFYPVESLKRGGRFYMCWVADSWPLRFATITHRQLWSQDIRRICDDLLEVMTNESGRPTNRFSLRLSSQLMRGVVRLYQKKVSVFLSDLCMINATVTKHVNKKWNIHEVEVEAVVRRPLPQLELVPQPVQEEPENERRIEEIIQNSGNQVGNIQDITLKEATIPQLQLPVNDGFGEENPDQALALLANQTVEMMLVQDASAVQHSGLDLLQLDTTADRSHDKSRDRSRMLEVPTMERIDELDISLFRKSTTAEDRLTIGELEKDIPEIPEIPPLNLPGETTAPQVIQEPQIEIIPAPEPEIPQPPQDTAKEQELVEIELEELEENAVGPKRKRPKKLIVDKRIMLSADYLVTRIENPEVELRCEDSSDDIIPIRVPVDIYLRRPAHAGPLFRRLGVTITRLFERNLGVYNRQGFADREMEEAVAERPRRVRTRSVLEKIEEDRELLIAHKSAQIEPMQIETRESIEGQNVTLPQELNTVEVPDVSMVQELTMAQKIAMAEDIADLPTQKLEELSQSRKRTSEYEVSPKRQRLIGYVSFRESQQAAKEAIDIEAEKENIASSANVPRATRSHPDQAPRTTRSQPPATQSPEKSLTVMLQEVGLADYPTRPDEQTQEQRNKSDEQTTSQEHRADTRGSESVETQLGSLDRTKVSLGDSDQTTESKRFIRDQWGTEGTMVKILGCVRAGRRPLTVRRLVAGGPVVAGCKAIIAARCFTSILKLKQHGFVIVTKDPVSLEIMDIALGPKFDQVQ